MKLKTLTVCFLLSAGLLASCIQDEALNTEADIESITLAGNVMNRPAMFGEAIRMSDGSLVYPATLYVKQGTDLTRLAPVLTLTEGATVEPPSGTTLDFTKPQTYVVTSQDGQWQRTYRVNITTAALTTTHYSFENIRLGGNPEKYHVFYEPEIDWATANPGFALSDMNEENPLNFPTYQSPDGWLNNCAVLVTRRAGSLAESVNMPIASGNLFLGYFDVTNALSNALTATQFGLPFSLGEPVSLSGYFKYKSGETFYELDTSAPDKLRPVPGRKDRFDLYAVLYESTAERPILDATEIPDGNSPQVISMARISEENAIETEEWTRFELPFEYLPGKSFDPQKLKDGGYNLTIVLASSVRGAYFEGAPGSTLCVDEIDLQYK